MHVLNFQQFKIVSEKMFKQRIYDDPVRKATKIHSTRCVDHTY